MHYRKILIIVALITAFLIIGCNVKPQAGANTSNPEKQELNAIQNPEQVSHNTFSIMKPKEWREVQYASNILIYLPPESDINNSFSEKYSMAVGFLPENNTASLKELTDMDMKKMKEIMPALDIIGDYEDSRFGQLDGLKIRFSIRVKNKTIESTQLRTMQGRVFYAFSQQCLERECKHTDIFNEMIEGFEWRNP